MLAIDHNDIEIDIESLEENIIAIKDTKIQELELELQEERQHTISLIDENEKLKKNLSKLIENYPKNSVLEKIYNDKCSICLEKYKLKDDITLTNCLHLFHKHCLDENIDNNRLTCPICRHELEHSIFLYLKFQLEYKGTEFL